MLEGKKDTQEVETSYYGCTQPEAETNASVQQARALQALVRAPGRELLITPPSPAKASWGGIPHKDATLLGFTVEYAVPMSSMSSSRVFADKASTMGRVCGLHWKPCKACQTPT